MNEEPIHEIPAQRVFAQLRSRPTGLTNQEAAARLLEVGANRLEPPSRLRWAKSLVKQFVNFFSLLLDIAAVVCFIADSIQPGEGMALLGWTLLGVAVLNALFAFAQEMRAERAMEELRKFLPQTVRVRRDGSEQHVLAKALCSSRLKVWRSQAIKDATDHQCRNGHGQTPEHATGHVRNGAHRHR